MTSLSVKRTYAVAIGVVYAVIYGFWTMLATGGGHGNFIWFLLFLFVEFGGLYFPLMVALSVNLKPFLVRVIFGSLIAFNLIVSSIMIVGWANESRVDGPSDFEKMMQIYGLPEFLIFPVAHFFPTLIFAFLLIRSMLFDRSLAEKDDTVNLNLY
ncbi:MAG: hypothetical protein ABIV48_13885 [Pyrinomonadaceae bacterium]